MSRLNPSEKKQFQTRIDIIRELSPMPEANRHRYDLRNIKTGGYFTFNGENWKVQSISRYQETQWNFQRDKRCEVWELEVISLKTAEIHFIEWEFDDQLEIHMTENHLKFRDITDENDQRIGKSDLDRLSDQEGGVKYKGKTYWYDDDESWAAKFFRNNQGNKPERVRFYEFKTKNGDGLTIEAWYDEDERECDIWTSREVKARNIQVIQLERNKTL